MTAAYMQYELDDDSMRVFRWRGGEYIEVGYIENGDFQAVDIAANVWDYEAGRPRIERSLEAFQARCDKYVREVELEEAEA